MCSKRLLLSECSGISVQLYICVFLFEWPLVDLVSEPHIQTPDSEPLSSEFVPSYYRPQCQMCTAMRQDFR